MAYLGIFKQKAENTIVIFDISTLSFVIMQKFKQSKIKFKIESKNTLLEYFVANI